MSNNALHTAAKAGNVAEMQVQIGKFDINAKGQFDMTALNWAAHDGKTEVVKLLLTHNPAPDVNMPNVSIQTVISVHLIRIFHIPYIYTIPSFLPLPTCVDITCSRCTTFTFYNSTWYSTRLVFFVFFPIPYQYYSLLPRSFPFPTLYPSLTNHASYHTCCYCCLLFPTGWW